MEKDVAIRAAVDTLPVLRAVAGPVLANHLSNTPPEERTWGQAAVVAAISGTDLLDGYGARKIGTTTYGGWLDQIADKMYVIPGQLALKRNGEMPPVHPYLKIGRDLGVSTMRIYAAQQGRDVSAGSLGKRKAVAEMFGLTLASSPLARDPDRIRAGVSIATALSLTSFFDYLTEYARSRQTPQPAAEATTRNAALRQKTASPVDKLVTLIDEKAPYITADHLTDAGRWLVIGAAALAVKNPDKPAVPTVMYTVGSLFDALDGSLARKKGANTGNGTTVEGLLKDVRSDKIQEIITFGALSMIARKRGNHVAANNYAAATMSAVLPALFRAHAESNGLIVAEGGIGTRTGRGILAGIGMALNRHQDTSDILSAVVATNNVITAEERRRVITRGEDAPDYKGRDSSPKFQKEAKLKRRALIPLAAAGVAAGAVLAKKRGK